MWLVGMGAVSGNLPFRLEPGEFIIGRTKRAQIVIVDATVSRRHARLVNASGSLTLEDLDSANGTFVNERPVSKCEVRVGDQIRCGRVICAVVASPLSFHAPSEEESTCRLRGEMDDVAVVDVLTAAQQEIVSYLLSGKSEAEIASILDKSPHTIHTHLKAIFQRVGVHSKAELIVKLLKRE